METTAKYIGDRVRQLRKNRGWSQSDLALKANISLTTVNRLEKGHQPPRADTLAAVTKALNISEKDLYETSEVKGSTKADSIAFIVGALTALDERELRAISSKIRDFVSLKKSNKDSSVG